MVDTNTYFDVVIEKIVNETSANKTFILTKPANFNNLPGQFCWLTLPEFRAQSPDFPRTPMAVGSGVEEDKLIFSFRHWGFLTGKFFELKIGDTLSVSQPLGSPVPIDLFESTSSLLIAGGTGVVPIRSLIQTLNSHGNYKVLYGAKSPSELLFKDELATWNSEIIVEQADNGSDWKGPKGFVTKLLNKSLIEIYKYCYICGPFPMMQNTVAVLKKIGYSADHIYVSLEKIENNEVIGPVFPVSDPNVAF